jgi:hypothetical protein
MIRLSLTNTAEHIVQTVLRVGYTAPSSREPLQKVAAARSRKNPHSAQENFERKVGSVLNFVNKEQCTGW